MNCRKANGLSQRHRDTEGGTGRWMELNPWTIGKQNPETIDIAVRVATVSNKEGQLSSGSASVIMLHPLCKWIGQQSTTRCLQGKMGTDELL